jgi:membrane protein required for colicin V production
MFIEIGLQFSSAKNSIPPFSAQIPPTLLFRRPNPTGYTSPMQTYDIIMLVVLAGATLFGVWKGMAWQAASLGSLVLSAFVAVRFSGSLAPLFSAEKPWNRFLAMLVLYLATALLIWIVFRFISKMIDRVKLKEFDRQLGALFGLLKGALLCIVITFFAVTLRENTRQMVLQSYSGHAIAEVTRRAGPLLPEDVRGWIGKYIDELDRKLDPNTPPDVPKKSALTEGKNPEADTLKTAQEKGEQILGKVNQKIGDLKQAGKEVQGLNQDLKQAVEKENKSGAGGKGK